MAASSLSVSAHIKVGCDCLNVVKDDADRKLFLNGYETMSDRGDGDDSFAAVMSDILSKLFKSGKGKVIMMIDGGTGGLMKDVAGRLGKSIGNDKVDLKDGNPPKSVEPADFKVATAVNMDALANNIGVLASKIAAVADAIDSARDAGLMITRKRLVQSMWGADKMQRILDGVRVRLENLDYPWSKVAVSSEVMTKSAPRLQRKLSSENSGDDGMVANVLIPGINDGYLNVKRAAEEIAVSIVPLVYIDDAFQRNTTYPATWFFDQDMMDGVSQGYDTVVDFLTQIPKIESKVMDPLSLARMRIIDGEK